MTLLTSFTFLLLPFVLQISNAVVFNIRNNCQYTVWAGALPGGGRKLNPGESWPLMVPAGTKGGRIWPRTNCNFNVPGQRACETGDCNGRLECNSPSIPPNTLAEYTLDGDYNLDYFDISLVDGFNMRMFFGPTSPGCTRGSACRGHIKDVCPPELRAPGGCNNPCTVYQTQEYCCTNKDQYCGPTNYSRIFKEKCPDAYSYPRDDPSSTFTCPTGTNYKVVFCPN